MAGRETKATQKEGLVSIQLLTFRFYSTTMKQLLILLVLFLPAVCFSQSNLFQEAYNSNPEIPRGVLEAVAWTNTRMEHLSDQAESCSGYPKAYGIMGLHDDGKNYFIENGSFVANKSGISIEEQKASAGAQILAYAKAYELIRLEKNLPPNDPQTVRELLHALSEIPDSGYVNYLAREMQVYEIFKFLSNVELANQYGFTPWHINFKSLFGSSNYAVLSADRVLFEPAGIRNQSGDIFSISPEKSLQYGPAIWDPTSCNFSSRNGVAVSAITIHTIQGTYAGAISWAKNCSSNVSYHYVLRSSDGQVTQMVLEEDKAWHVGSENPYTIGYEHEGYVDNPAWYTEAMYQSSAALSRDVVDSGYGIPALRTYYGPSSVGINTLGGCTKIKGHQHYPNQSHTDPGINWDWEKYYQLINNEYTATILNNSSGVLTDSGGASGDYSDDERELWLIEPTNAASITLNFNSFALELNYDFLFIYDGDSVNAPLIGVYTGTNSPGIVSSTGPSMLVEFRSDCSTVNAGWEASYTSTLNDTDPPISAITTPQDWKTDDFIVSFSDTDTQGTIYEKYVLITKNELTTDEWYGASNYLFEDFELSDSRWTNHVGSYLVQNNAYYFLDENEQNSNSFISVSQDLSSSFLYSFDLSFESSFSSQRAGIHFFCDDPTGVNRGNSYFVFLRESDDLVQIYRVENDVFTLVSSVPFTIIPSTNYHVKTSFDPVSGWIQVFIDNQFVSAWQDSNPHSYGNSISLRTAGCAARFDDVRMYRSRGTSITIEVGPTDEISAQSLAAAPTVRVHSLAKDDANNWSSIAEESYLIDYSKPSLSALNDGVANDIDTFYTSTLDANWSAYDPHSNIQSFEYAIGTLPQLNNVIDWTTVSLATSLSEVLNSPVYGQIYYVSLRVKNGAGLEDQFMSNGQRYLEGLGINGIELTNLVLYPNPAGNEVHISGLTQELAYELYSEQGQLAQVGKTSGMISLTKLSQGQYHLRLVDKDRFVVLKLIKN